jgi:hypothetical protein
MLLSAQKTYNCFSTRVLKKHYEGFANQRLQNACLGHTLSITWELFAAFHGIARKCLIKGYRLLITNQS